MRLSKLAKATLVLAFSSVAYGQAPSEVVINNLDVSGSGCPVGSVTTDVSSDRKAFTILFDSYVVQAGPDIAQTENRKFCQVMLNLHVPQGWQYSIFKADYAGFAELMAGTQGIQTSTYYFQGNLRRNVKFDMEINGPYSADYMVSDEVGLESVVWSNCNESRALQLKTSLQVRASGANRAMMTLDSIDGEMKHVYGLQWKRC